MKLIFLGELLDSNIEQILTHSNKFGLKVSVVYNSDSWISKIEGEQVVEIFNNCTEIHHLYKTFDKNEKNIAFESDIHRTGYTRSVNDIESVEITNADKLEVDF